MKQFLFVFIGLLSATVAGIAAYRGGAAKFESAPEPPAIMADDEPLPPRIEEKLEGPPEREERPALQPSVAPVVTERPKPKYDSLGPTGLPELNLVIRLADGWHARVDNHAWTYRSGVWYDDAGELPPRPVAVQQQQLPRAQALPVRVVPQRAAARFHSMAAICPVCRSAGCPGGNCPSGGCRCGACG